MIDKLIGVTVLLANFDQLDDQLASVFSHLCSLWATSGPHGIRAGCCTSAQRSLNELII
jgi:hypothetical protein